MLEFKSPSETQVIMTELVLPNDTNLLGNLLGGRLMHWLDICGALAASRHSNSIVVTAGVEKLDFRHPVRIGEMVVLTARLIWCGRTSMKVKVIIESENLLTGLRIITNKATLTFVAMSKVGTPIEVPRLKPQTVEEQELYDREQEAYELKKNLKK